MKSLTREQVREIDRRASEELGIPTLTLMENAGRGAADILQSLDPKGPILVLCGKGNNGGDGLVVARHSLERKIECKVLLTASAEQLSPDARANLQRLNSHAIITDWKGALSHCEWVVDALFGTGFHGAVRPPYDVIIRAVNESGVPVFAIDLPSGLDANTGEPSEPTIRARHTATFVAPKVGFAQMKAQPFLGKIHVIDIGVPEALVDEILAIGEVHDPSHDA